MDWVEEAPERELPDRDEDREFGFTSLALGASASSLWFQTDQTSTTFISSEVRDKEKYTMMNVTSQIS